MPDLTTRLAAFLAVLGTGQTLPSLTGILNANTTAVGNVGTGTDDLITYALPASALEAVGQSLRVRAWGTTAGNANAKTLTINFGATVVYTKALEVATATNLQTGQWIFDMLVTRTGASTQAIVVSLRQLLGGTAAIRDEIVGHGIVAATETDTAAITIKCTGAATSDNDIVQSGLIVEGLL